MRSVIFFNDCLQRSTYSIFCSSVKRKKLHEKTVKLQFQLRTKSKRGSTKVEKNHDKNVLLEVIFISEFQYKTSGYKV